MDEEGRNATLTDISEGYADDVAEDYGDERQYRKNKQEKSNYLKKYIKLVSGAEKGCITI